MLSKQIARPVRRTAVAVASALTAASLVGSGLGATSAAAATVGPDGQPIVNAKGVVFGITAHRGGILERPENSLEAFQYSVDQGFDAIETDIQFTADGVGVMNHDDTLASRCTNTGQKIHEMTLAQVREVRCADRSGQKTAPIPTYDEMVAVLKGKPIDLHLEIKAWAGQSTLSKRLNAARSINLVITSGMMPQTSIVTFHWEAMLPTIRMLSPDIRVAALDDKKMDLKRVRLAATLKANAYGIKPENAPINMLKYTQQLGMSVGMWRIHGAQSLSTAIYYGPMEQFLTTDVPNASRQLLVSGKTNINPVPTSVVTKLPTTVTIAKKATYKAKARKYPVVMGVAVPAVKIAQLDTVTVKIDVTKGPGKGYVYLGAMDSPTTSDVKVKLPKGTKTVYAKVPVGTGGKIRVSTSKTASLALSVSDYTNIVFN